MTKATKAALFAHVQKFVREAYADRLRKAGFSSYHGEDIHWFRLVNQDLVHAIYFVADYVSFPVNLEIQYGCHPMFIPPVLQGSPYMPPLPGSEQRYYLIPELTPGSTPRGVQRSALRGPTNRTYRVPDVLVSCPADEQVTHQVLNNVLSVLDAVDHPEACYSMHKKWRGPEIENGSWITMTPFFLDEVIYWEDKSLYAFCAEYINGKIRWLENVKQDSKPLRKVDEEELIQLHEIRKVLTSAEARQDYIQKLKNKSLKNRVALKKHVFINADD